MSSGTTGAPGPKPRIHERVIILVNATASEQYNCIRRLTEALVFTVTIVFIIVYELHHDTFKEKSREVLAVDVVKWFWLLASNCYLWFILIAEHVIRDLLPLQPLAMAMLIVGYFAYAAFVCVDLLLLGIGHNRAVVDHPHRLRCSVYACHHMPPTAAREWRRNSAVFWRREKRSCHRGCRGGEVPIGGPEWEC